jgi:prepilin-type N-terminal cleavage/methylation domain-containing protein
MFNFFSSPYHHKKLNSLSLWERYGVKVLKNNGFSLVEMAVVLVIISTILGSMMVLTNKAQDKAKYEATIAKVKEIDALLQQYAIKGGVIPCPAIRTATLNSSTFGVATDCAAAVGAGITEVGQVRIGVVPTRTLGLPDNYMFDEWGMRITYAVNKNLATNAAAFNAYTKPVAGGIAIQDSADNSVFDTNIALTKLFPAYVVISHGSDKKGATVQVGTSTNACSGSSHDVLNCGNTGVFRDTTIKLINKSLTAYFDDIIIWRTYDFLDNANDYTSELN